MLFKMIRGVMVHQRGKMLLIAFTIALGASLATGYMRTESTSWYYINLYEDNTHCLDWLRQHCDEEIQVLRGGNWVKCGAAD